MDNWDDYRIFLAVQRNGSIRGAAAQLSVNHATVSRRIGALEARLGVRLFEKLPSGYVTTPAADEILAQAEAMEGNAVGIERQVFARDSALNGALRVTLPPILATELLMPDLARFADLHPGINLELITSYTSLNITRREADVALRLIFPNQSPPAHLYGKRLAPVSQAAFCSAQGNGANRWISKEGDTIPASWRAQMPTDTPKLGDITLTDTRQRALAAATGMGHALLPCFAGDLNPNLKRLIPGKTEPFGDIWSLTHGDLRHTARVRAFLDFISTAIRRHRPVLAGQGGAQN